MKQRSEEERVQELQAKIAAIQARGERKRARANPAVRQAVLAVKAIDKASSATSDATARKALEDAREPLSAWLTMEGLTLSTAATDAPTEATVKRPRRKNNTGMSVASA